MEGQAVDQAKAAARATDDYVHDNPWQAIGVAAAVGFLVGPCDRPSLAIAGRAHERTRRRAARAGKRAGAACRSGGRPSAHARRARRARVRRGTRAREGPRSRSSSSGSAASRWRRSASPRSSSRTSGIAIGSTALGAVTLAYLLAGVLALWRFSVRRQNDPKPFAATIAELERDREWLAGDRETAQVNRARVVEISGPQGAARGARAVRSCADDRSRLTTSAPRSLRPERPARAGRWRPTPRRSSSDWSAPIARHVAAGPLAAVRVVGARCVPHRPQLAFAVLSATVRGPSTARRRAP